MAVVQQLEMLKRGALEWNQWRQSNPDATIDLAGADLAGRDLSEANLHGADLSGANLHGADLSGANLTEASLHKADFRGARLNNTNLTEARLEQAKFPEADLGAAVLIRAKLAGADFTHANLSHSDLSGADLHESILVQANLEGANVSMANLRDADLTHSRIVATDFRASDVAGADLHRVHPSNQTIWPPLPSAAVLQYFYLLRVPILMGITLFTLPILSLTEFHSLLGNLFVLDRLNIFWTMVATVTLAFSILVTFRVVLLNGMQRFGVQQALTKDQISTPALVFSEILALPMLILMVCSNGQAPHVTIFLIRLGVGLLGAVVAHVGGYVVLLVAVLLSQRYGIPADQRYPFLFPWMKKLLVRAENYELISAEWRQKPGDWGKGGSHAFKAGYFDPGTGLLYPGHWLSFVSLAATISLYLFIGHRKQDRKSTRLNSSHMSI